MNLIPNGIFSWTKRIFSELILLISKSYFSHVEFDFLRVYHKGNNPQLHNKFGSIHKKVGSTTRVGYPTPLQSVS